MARDMRAFLSLLLLLPLIAQEAPPLPKAEGPASPRVMEGKPSYTRSGTQYWDIEVGSGKKAIAGFTVQVHYTGWYKKNKTTYVMFESSLGRKPIRFDLGMGRVIKGWDEGVQGMKVGGKRQLVIPPDSAYGRQGTANIPPNMPLIFEVELVDVR